MKKDILINSTSDEIRIAITEDNKLSELFWESPDQERNVGDIHLGKVAKVLPGIRAAFIDIGFKQDAFLHFSDIGSTTEDLDDLLGDDSDIDEEDEEEEDIQPQTPVIERGQNIVVQITKEPVGNKGVRVTSKVSLPGRYLVLMPFNKRVGVSKKIFSFKERKRLRSLVRQVLPRGFGLIIRTAASGQEDNLILDDLNNLLKSWSKIEVKLKSSQPPTLLYKDAGTTSSVIRDLFREDVSKVIIDTKKLHKEIRGYLETTSPELLDKVEYYSGNQPLFDVHSVERQIEESLNKKVWLKSGGYLIIETTEAMTVVDVNSGKYAKSKDHEQNALNTDMEAAREIVRQLRLRDIGGIIVIDFIDLYEDRNRKKLNDELRKEFKKDRAKVTVLPMSEFGLVQITRQRVRQSILHSVSELCPMCKGTGRVQSKTTFITRIERWIQRYKGSSNRKRSLILKVNPIIAGYLRSGMMSAIRRMSFRYKIYINTVGDEAMGFDDFKFLTRKGEDITDEFTHS